MAQNDFIDVGLGELLRLDLVLLAGAQQIVQKRHVQLEHFHELDDATVGDVEFAVEVEGPRVAVAAVLGDLAVVDVAGQLGRILILFVLGLERADADAVFLAQQQALDADILDNASPVTLILLQQVAVDVAAEGAQLAGDLDAILAGGHFGVEPAEDFLAEAVRNQVQGLLVHGAPLRALLGGPAERIQCASILGAIALQAFFQQPGDRALAAAHGAMQQQHALFDAIALRGAFESVDQHAEGLVETEHGVFAMIFRVAEEGVADVALAKRLVGLAAVRHDHVVHALEGVSRYAGLAANQVEILFESPLPILAAELVEILSFGDEGNDFASTLHGSSSSTGAGRAHLSSEAIPDRQGPGDSCAPLPGTVTFKLFRASLLVAAAGRYVSLFVFMCGSRPFTCRFPRWEPSARIAARGLETQCVRARRDTRSGHPLLVSLSAGQKEKLEKNARGAAGRVTA